MEDISLMLRGAARRLRECDVPADITLEFERLAEQVHHPCVVAVVGRVKAGKSTFINALLGEDLAKVGTTETTATINYFRYGRADPDRPVRCHWRGGQVTEEGREFLDALQGSDEETLRRADGIDHLEYHLPNPYLQQVTLVDTPGTGAVVDTHQNRTAEFMRLTSQLRERHHQETQRIGGEADAVVYLIGSTVRVSDRDVLTEFQELTSTGGARALNAVGVMAKIDLQPEVMRRRDELATKIGQQLREQLNVVIPVSAGLERAIDHLCKDDGIGLQAILDAMRRIPPARLEKLLDNADFYLNLEFPDCPVTPHERAELVADLSWTVFTTIARTAADVSLSRDAVVERLREVAGFSKLRTTLEHHFLQRSAFLHNYRILDDARRLLRTITLDVLPERRRQARENTAMRERFLTYLDRPGHDQVIAAGLRAVILNHLSTQPEIGPVIDELDVSIGKAYHELEEYNADFEALNAIETHADLFPPVETDELRALFGAYGLELAKRLRTDDVPVSHVEERQRAWRRVATFDLHQVRRKVSDRAVERYGLILDDLLSRQ